MGKWSWTLVHIDGQFWLHADWTVHPIKIYIVYPSFEDIEDVMASALAQSRVVVEAGPFSGT